MKDQITKKLQKEKTHNPFHKDYDKESVLRTIEASSFDEGEIDQERIMAAISSSFVSILISPLFDETYKELKRLISLSSLSTLQIIRFLIVSVNRNYLLVKQQYQSKLQGVGGIDYLDSYRFKIESLDSEVGDIHASDSIESEIDALNILFNYLRYFEGKTFNSGSSKPQELESVNCILSMTLVGGYYNLVKKCYEDAIWNNGYIYLKKESNSLIIDYHSYEELKLLKVGGIRLKHNSTGTYFNLLSLNRDDSFTSPFAMYKKKKRIKKAFITNGIVNYKLAKGSDKKEIDHEIKLLSELYTYYPFIGNQNFPKFKDLNLEKVLAMFSSLQSLFRKIAEINIPNDGIKNIREFDKFPHRIKVSTLKEYLSKKLHFSNAQIIDFLSLLEVKFDKSSRINFWDNPLVRYKDEYLFTLIGINDPLISHLIDHWLNEGGFILDKRGELLEKYLKNQLKRIVKQKGYFITIPDTSMFKITGRGKEEIDLILNFKNIVVIAEVKCIKYPFEIRDYHNSYKRLTKASNQVARKTNFVRDNLDFFSEEVDGIEDKEIISLVITNFPNFSGFKINNIPIVDVYLLEAYILSGKMFKSKISFKKRGMIVKDDYDEVVFYENEDSFCKNIAKCMETPPTIEEIKSKIEIQQNLKARGVLNYNLYLNEPIVKDHPK
jgi:hypothetical protein